MLEFVQEEVVDFAPFVDRFRCHAAAQRFSQIEQTLVASNANILFDFCHRHGLALVFRQGQMVDAILQRADGFQHRFLERMAHGHNFACRFHLRAESAVALFEFIERETRNFRDDVIQSRLESRIGSAGDRVLHFIQSQADSDLRRHLRNRITGRFTRQSRRTADARVHFDDVVVERVRIQRQLDITAAFDFQGTDDL